MLSGNSDCATTVAEKLATTFGVHALFPTSYYEQGACKDRVVVHDLIHLLLINRAWPVNFTIRDEYAAAIVQAVLTRDTRISLKSKHDGAGEKAFHERPLPTLQDIQQQTLPEIPGFIRRMQSKASLPTSPHIPEPALDFVESRYEAAKLFDTLFAERYGRPFGQVPAAELMKMEYAPIKEMFQQAACAAGFGLQKPGPKESQLVTRATTWNYGL